MRDNAVNARNTATVEQELKDMRAKILEQQIIIDGFARSMSSMAERMNALELLVCQFKARSFGNGPSVK